MMVLYICTTAKRAIPPFSATTKRTVPHFSATVKIWYLTFYNIDFLTTLYEMTIEGLHAIRAQVPFHENLYSWRFYAINMLRSEFCGKIVFC